ncbi:hypothetical protein LEP1GSC051_4235 [Leptospira sp. P2653]|nr:hypothetical protein LEP1GSC051_4235 [Leptospira sp. P2653]
MKELNTTLRRVVGTKFDGGFCRNSDRFIFRSFLVMANAPLRRSKAV